MMMMTRFVKFFVIIIPLLLASCSTPQDRLYKKLSKEDAGHTKYKGHYKIGEQYEIKNQTYTPKKPPIDYKEEGVASWYGAKDKFHGKTTANGDKYNKNVLSAAHRTLPMPSLVKVTNLSNGKSLVLMVNDRGPFAKGRIIDVSEQAASILGFKRQGTAKVRVEYLPHDTKQFLRNIALKDKPNSIAKAKVKNHKCSINCHVKLVNLKYNLPITP